MTIDAEIGSFLGQSSLADNTIKSYRAHLNLFRSFLYENHGTTIAIQDLNKPIVQSFLDWVTTKGGDGSNQRPYRSHASLVAMRACLKSFFNFVMETSGSITTIPLPRVTERISIPRNPVYLTRREKDQFLQAVRASRRTRDILIFSLFLSTAMRLSELLSVTPRSLDSEKNLISVRLKRGEVRPYLVIGRLLLGRHTRKNTSRRPTHALWRMLRRYIVEREIQPDVKVFNITARQVQALALHYGQEAGIAKRVTPHKLRHTAAVLLSELRVTQPVLQRILHHKSAATTAIYGEVTHADASLALKGARLLEPMQRKHTRRTSPVRRKGRRRLSLHRSRKRRVLRGRKL